jgi:hypothetical protein
VQGDEDAAWVSPRATLVVLRKSDHEPHSAAEQKNVQQGMSNFEGPVASAGRETLDTNGVASATGPPLAFYAC